MEEKRMGRTIRIIAAGFSRYIKKRKNLTAALSFIFFLAFFFIRVFEALDGNLERFWMKNAVTGDHILSTGKGRADIMKPVSPAFYFSAEGFYSQNPGLAAASSPRLRMGVMAESSERSDNFENAFILVGVDAVREKSIFGAIELEEGPGFSGAVDEIILPRSIMNGLCVALGQSVALAARTQDGFLNMEAARVVGVLAEPSTAFVFGTYQGIAPLELARRLALTDSVSEIVATPRSGGPRGPYRRFPALSCFGVSRAVSIAYAFLRWTVLLFLGIFALGIVYQNVVSMNDERRGEIAVYLTYGAEPAWVAALMFGELALYCLYCAIIGGILGLAALGGLTMAGIYPIDTMTDVLLGGEGLNLWPSPSSWLAAFAALVSIVFLSAGLPVAKAVSPRNIAAMFRKA
jgi:ABC-type lipoprotein release transport system permease subunit